MWSNRGSLYRSHPRPVPPNITSRFAGPSYAGHGDQRIVPLKSSRKGCKNMVKKILAASAVALAAMIASPAFACTGNACPTSPTVNNTLTVALDIGGASIGDAVGFSGNEGKYGNAYAQFTDENLLKLNGEIYGADDGCVSNCGTSGALFNAFVGRKISGFLNASAEDGTYAAASVNSAQNAAAALQGLITITKTSE